MLRSLVGSEMCIRDSSMAEPPKPPRQRRTFTDVPPAADPIASRLLAQPAPSTTPRRCFTEKSSSDQPEGGAPGEDAPAKRRRASKWDVATPTVAPTAAQLSGCNRLNGLPGNPLDNFLLQNKTQGAEPVMPVLDEASGHHMNDFIPQAEMAKFHHAAGTAQAAQAAGNQIAEKLNLDQTNKGFQMMQSMGWTAATPGLGAGNTGIAAPIQAIGQTMSKFGIGVPVNTHEPQAGDDDFTLYRKRMMLGYKHRPNPFNNPRNSYY
eukprot:TRINITY_DN50546_c0_g2_i1.p1 TRINITY_DN50546_c0_g2~~TRINITY_DN50546_c0_g2_i1.p1  ORF type:complete len:264 (+),score=55.96 TRINITY_DN50546_c0_g2_i1:120-911(+)